MAKKGRIGILSLIIITLIISSLALAETGGTINMSNMISNSSAVTGLWGVTQTTTSSTTTTTVSNSSSNTSSGDISTGNYTATTSSTVRNTTTTTVRSTTTTLRYIQYNAANDWKNYSESKLNSTLIGTPKLAEAVSRFFNLADVDKNVTEDLNKNMTITKTLFVYKEGYSTIDLDLFYNGDIERKNVIIFDTLPKTFANSTDYIAINATLISLNSTRTVLINYSVVERDPSYIFKLDSIKKGDGIIINYTVAGNASSSAINSTSTVVFAGPQKDDFTWIIVIAFSVSILAILLAIFKDKIKELMTRGSKYHHYRSHLKPSNLGEFIKKIKEKFAKKKKLDPHFFYKNGSKK